MTLYLHLNYVFPLPMRRHIKKKLNGRSIYEIPQHVAGIILRSVVFKTFFVPSESRQGDLAPSHDRVKEEGHVDSRE